MRLKHKTFILSYLADFPFSFLIIFNTAIAFVCICTVKFTECEVTCLFLIWYVPGPWAGWCWRVAELPIPCIGFYIPAGALTEFVHLHLGHAFTNHSPYSLISHLYMVVLCCKEYRHFLCLSCCTDRELSGQGECARKITRSLNLDFAVCHKNQQMCRTQISSFPSAFTSRTGN